MHSYFHTRKGKWKTIDTNDFLAVYPLRNISDASQSTSHKLTKSIIQLFSGYTGQSEHYSSSHSQLIDIFYPGKFNGGLFVSHDAAELLPSFILMDTVQFLEEKMANSAKWALKLTFHNFLNCSFLIGFHISNTSCFSLTSQWWHSK